ncbi:MAG: lipopolysaccharide transport periplasmic protein LptA [Burkholderiales bacterium]|nr:lipopolysaccharide transport periplasmic protein LptA [Burkholderiales bacterium]
MHSSPLPFPVRRWLLLLCIALPAISAQAEKADSLKETVIEAEHSVSDGKKKIHSLNGDVTVTRGTLLVKAERAVVTELEAGHSASVLTGGPGGLVRFRQKRDGGPDLWVEGEAEKVEYDDKTELVKFISKARVRYLEGKKTTQEQEGEFLSYDSQNDVFIATNSSKGEHVLGAGRVKLTLQPKTDRQETK